MKKRLINWVILYSLILVSIGLSLFVIFRVPEKTAEDIFDESLLSVAEIKAFDSEDAIMYGSAVCIGNDGKFITNSHVVSYKEYTETKVFGTIQIRLASSEEYINATLEKIDYEKDLALIKVDLTNSNIRVQEIKVRAGKLQEGETVYAIGNAQNYGISIINGIVSQCELNVEVNEKTITAVQCALNITDGNSGGALVDTDGNLIGITTFRLKDKAGNVIYGTSFALPIKTVNEFLGQI